jgi:hypothetical protein
MISLYPTAFYLGVFEELEKHARCWEGYEPVPGKEPYSEDSCQPKSTKKKKEKKAVDLGTMPVNENILPNIKNQAKWRFVRTKDGLKLSDGNLVYSFGGFPEEFPAEDTRLARSSDDNILNFENDAISKGTAQIHRSSPDNIYMTLATGKHNPTFMLQHEEGKNWRYIPSKKFVEKLKKLESPLPSTPREEVISEPKAVEQNMMLIDPDALFDGGTDTIKKAFEGLGLDADDLANMISSGVHGAQHLGSSLVQTAAENPVLAGLGTYAGLNMLSKKQDPRNKDPRYLRLAAKQKLDQGPAVLPLAAALTVPVASSMVAAQK